MNNPKIRITTNALAGLVSLVLSGCTEIPLFQEKDGVLAVEAEDFASQRSVSSRSWYLISENSDHPALEDPDDPHYETASGGAYLEILPDTRVTHDDTLKRGVNFSNQAGEMAVLDYKVYFNNPGKYYVWVRAYSTGTEDNGIHVGIDGTWPESGQRMQWCDGKNAWTWDSKQRTEEVHCGVPQLIWLEVPSAGKHTISFSMREDGFEFDKWAMTKEYHKPVGEGPPPVLKN